MITERESNPSFEKRSEARPNSLLASRTAEYALQHRRLTVEDFLDPEIVAAHEEREAKFRQEARDAAFRRQKGKTAIRPVLFGY